MYEYVPMDQGVLIVRTPARQARILVRFLYVE